MIIRGPLRYLIGRDGYPLDSRGCVIEVSFDYNKKPVMAEAIGYCNLFNEKYAEQHESQRRWYGPYLHDSDTAEDYSEGEIDPSGPGWERNLNDQFERRLASGFEYVELDNPDAYGWPAVKSAIELAAKYGLKVIAKNPLLCDQGELVSYVKHPNVTASPVAKGSEWMRV